MGCSSSKPGQRPVEPHENPRPVGNVPRSNRPSHTSQTPHLQSKGAAGGMLAADRNQFLRAVHTCLHDIPYIVIGGSALAEYGSSRATTDVDVLVGGGCSKRSAEDLLVGRSKGRLIRLGQGRLGFITPGGKTHELDLSIDTDVDLSFDPQRDVVIKGGARMGTLIFLLNSKARAWQTRVPFEQNYAAKVNNDANDILFCLRLLKGHKQVDRRQLNWVFSRHFWVPFLTAYPQAEALFRAAGIWTEAPNDSSGSSMGGRSSRVNWSQSGGTGSERNSQGQRQGQSSSSRVSSQHGSRQGSAASSRNGSHGALPSVSRGSGSGGSRH